jgi:undecaprenyl-diphosphatase
MVSFIQAIILSFVQGITEWFPISSSGHLAVAQEFLGVQNLGFDVYLHFASVLAVVILFWKDIVNLVVKKETKYILKIIIAIIPVAIIGLLLREHVKNAFSNLFFIGVFFIIFGVFIYFTKYSKKTKKRPSYLDSLYIGIAQMLAIFPGISRSGMTMGSGLSLGLKKEEAIKFSFLLAIPVIFGASLIEAREIAATNISFITFLTTFTITLLTSLLTIRFLIKIIKSNKFYLFGIYNMIFGLVVIILSLTKL